MNVWSTISLTGIFLLSLPVSISCSMVTAIPRFEKPPVQWKRVSVFIVSRRSFSGVHLNVLPESRDAIVAIFAGVSHASLKGPQELDRLLFLFCQPRFPRDEADVGPLGVKLF